MSFLGILASLGKTVPMGRLHKTISVVPENHWTYPQSLDIQMVETLQKCVSSCPLHTEEHNALLLTNIYLISISRFDILTQQQIISKILRASGRKNLGTPETFIQMNL